MPGDETNSGIPEMAGAFHTTHWSVVQEAQLSSLNGREALEKLCRAYWYPLYCFARCRGTGPHDAQDLTQSFFATFLEKQYLERVDPQRGRFRSFLLAAFKNFLINEWKRANALRRGGGCELVSIDAQTAEAQFAVGESKSDPPDTAFDRSWAATVFQAALNRLRQEYQDTGRSDLYDALRFRLWGEQDGPSNAELSARLGISEAAVKMATSRMRKAFREGLRREVANTVATVDEVDVELRHLITVLRR